MKPLKPKKQGKKLTPDILRKSIQKKLTSTRPLLNKKGQSYLRSKYSKVQINLASHRIWKELEQMEIRPAHAKGSTITKVEQKRATLLFNKAFELLIEQVVRRN